MQEKESRQSFKGSPKSACLSLQWTSVMEYTYAAAPESCLETRIWSSSTNSLHPGFRQKLEQILFEEICLSLATDSKKFRPLSHRGTRVVLKPLRVYLKQNKSTLKAKPNVNCNINKFSVSNNP